MSTHGWLSASCAVSRFFGFTTIRLETRSFADAEMFVQYGSGYLFDVRGGRAFGSYQGMSPFRARVSVARRLSPLWTGLTLTDDGAGRQAGSAPSTRCHTSRRALHRIISPQCSRQQDVRPCRDSALALEWIQCLRGGPL